MLQAALHSLRILGGLAQIQGPGARGAAAAWHGGAIAELFVRIHAVPHELLLPARRSRDQSIRQPAQERRISRWKPAGITNHRGIFAGLWRRGDGSAAPHSFIKCNFVLMPCPHVLVCVL